MSSEIREGDFFADRYRILKHLGDGTSGQTFLAKDSVRKETVVLRMLYPDVIADAGGWSGLLEPLKRLTQLNDPHVMRVYDFNQWQDHAFLICEHLTGQSIDQRVLQEERPIDHQTLTRWYFEILQTLARNSHVTPHWSLKPSNIWITSEGHIKLVDFGFGGLASEEKRRTTAMLKGQALYLAPEGFRHQRVDPFKQDQFAAGRVMDEIYQAWKSQNEARAELELSRRMSELLKKLQSPRPEQRFSKPKDLLATLDKNAQTHHSPQLLSKIPLPVFKSTHVWLLPVISVIALAIWIGSNRVSPAKNSADIKTSHLLSQWTEFNRSRMQFVEQLAPHSHPAAQSLKSQLDPVHESEWMRRLGALEQGRIERSLEERTADLKQLRDLLGQRRAFLQLARNAWNATEALQEQRDTLTALEPLPNRPEAGSPPKNLDIVIQKTLEQISRNLFHTADREIAKAISDTDLYIEQLLDRTEARLKEVQKQWDDTLVHAGLPRINIDPNLVAIVQDAQAAKEKNDIVQAIKAWQSATDLYRRWIDEMNQIPAPNNETWNNHLGMRFRDFNGLRVSIWETRIIDFAAYVATTGSDHRFMWRRNAIEETSGPTHPVTNVNYLDAINFCDWLTHTERSLELLPEGWAYRLPTDAEWSQLVHLAENDSLVPAAKHLKVRHQWPWGTVDIREPSAGNYYTPLNASERNHFRGYDPFLTTAPVGQFPPNEHGFFDLGGNVWEITKDPMEPGSLTDPKPPRSHRGGSWKTISLEVMLSSYRLSRRQGREDVGFRCVLAPDERFPVKAATNTKSLPPNGGYQ